MYIYCLYIHIYYVCVSVYKCYALYICCIVYTEIIRERNVTIQPSFFYFKLKIFITIQLSHLEKLLKELHCVTMSMRFDTLTFRAQTLPHCSMHREWLCKLSWDPRMTSTI